MYINPYIILLYYLNLPCQYPLLRAYLQKVHAVLQIADIYRCLGMIYGYTFYFPSPYVIHPDLFHHPFSVIYS